MLGLPIFVELLLQIGQGECRVEQERVDDHDAGLIAGAIFLREGER